MESAFRTIHITLDDGITLPNTGNFYQQGEIEAIFY